ncbi:MAG: exopolysaccharide biosynthesis polyprenyl glycosylphosphotransferase [Clostridiaceae bacterium]|jgi:exopolysaccharide biosynthesis polyprenyl glycosylphosphotransferase|nr:exopolysaccharide biosynthesis polyprenyl glycosylphosphotransferase [Clostridiaceae bacterium]
MIEQKMMQRRKVETKYVYRSVCALLLTLIATGMFLYTWYGFVSVNNHTGHLTGLANLGMATMIYAFLFLVIGRWLHAFSIGVDRKIVLLPSLALTIIVANFIEVFVSCAITGQFRFFHEFLGRYALLCLAQIVLLALLVIQMVNVYRRWFPPLRLLEIHGDHQNDLREKVNQRWDKYEIADTIYVEDVLDIFESEIRKYDGIIINDVPTSIEHLLIKKCYSLNKRVYYSPKLSDIIVHSASILNIFDTPLFLNRNQKIPFGSAFAKRTLDIVASLAGLIVLSPIFLITALAIKIEDGGSVFYKQERVTKDMKVFDIIKFRSMIMDAEEDGKPQLATKHDGRITKVGRVIRATRIDELPQLFNILKGDMSLVGPRPERVEYVEKYISEIPEFHFRHKVRGGLTGYAQVFGKYNTSPLDKLKLDLIYITNRTMLLDLQIVLGTLKILFNKESTEGIEEENDDGIRS